MRDEEDGMKWDGSVLTSEHRAQHLASEEKLISASLAVKNKSSCAHTGHM